MPPDETQNDPEEDEKWLKIWSDASGADILKNLPPLTKEEIDYYSNL